MKKLISIILSTAMIVSSTATTVFADGEDITAPVINSITITDEDTEYSVNDTVNFSFDITEDQTGISSAYVTMSSTEEDSHVQVPVQITEDNDLSGTYSGSMTINDSMRAGTWVSTYCYAVDKVGNEYSTVLNNDIEITIINEEESDITGPVITSWEPKETEVSLDDGNALVFTSSDSDLKSVTFRIGCLDGGIGRNISANITVNETGEYEVPFAFTSSDFTGNWIITNLYWYDTNGNKTEDFSYKNFTVTAGEEVVEEEHDTVKPSITSVSVDNTDITTPDSCIATITGTENTTGSSVDVTIAIGNSNVHDGTKYYNSTATVAEDGTWSTTMEISFDKNFPAVDGWKIYYASATDSSSNKEEVYDDFVVFNISTFNGTVDTEFTLSSSRLIEQINNAADGSTILINCDSAKVSSEVFEAIQGTNKTIVLNLDGIQWVFNGSEINNPKDIDLTVALEQIDISEYGYVDGTQGIRLNFAPNGVLPGKCDVRIKSDYISKLYGFNTDLYLAFIKSTADVTEEEHYAKWEQPKDEAGNPVYYITKPIYDLFGHPVYYSNPFTPSVTTGSAIEVTTGSAVSVTTGSAITASKSAIDNIMSRFGKHYLTYVEYMIYRSYYPTMYIGDNDQLFYSVHVDPVAVDYIRTYNYKKTVYTEIEDAGISVDENGYVTISLTHNSSYLLVSSLPTEDTTPVVIETPVTSTPAINTVSATPTVTTVSASGSGGGGGGGATTSTTLTASASKNNSVQIGKAVTISAGTNGITIGCKLSRFYNGYTVSISTDKSLKNVKKVSSSNMSSKMIGGLTSNTKYYGKIRMYKNIAGKKVYMFTKTFTIYTK